MHTQPLVKKYLIKLSFWGIALIVSFFLFLAISFVQAQWSEPLSNPPTSNIGTPITAGPALFGSPYQEKIGTGIFTGLINNTGSIGANDFFVGSYVIGTPGPFNPPGKWLTQLGAGEGCDWAGWKCDCRSDRVVIGFECTNETITDFKVVSFDWGASCPVTPDLSWGCAVYPSFSSIAAPSALNSALIGNFHPINDPTGIWTIFRLTWSDNSNNEDGFRIEYRPSSTASWSVLKTVAADITTTQVTVSSSIVCTSNGGFRVTAFRAQAPDSNSAITSVC